MDLEHSSFVWFCLVISFFDQGGHRKRILKYIKHHLIGGHAVTASAIRSTGVANLNPHQPIGYHLSKYKVKYFVLVDIKRAQPALHSFDFGGSPDG
jgi:hypothetical protein